MPYTIHNDIGACKLIEAVFSNAVSSIAKADMADLVEIADWVDSDDPLFGLYCSVWNRDEGRLRKGLMNLIAERKEVLDATQIRENEL